MDGIMHKWASPHFDDFEILDFFESFFYKLNLPKEQNSPSHPVVQANVCCLSMLIFGDFYRAKWSNPHF